MSTPAETSSVSTRVVLPDPAGPTSTTLRIDPGRSTTGTASFPTAPDACLPATSCLLALRSTRLGTAGPTPTFHPREDPHKSAPDPTPVSRPTTALVRMLRMRLDHVSYAAGPDGLKGTAARIGSLLGEEFRDGGIHPRFGTRNMVLPLTAGTYLEVVAVLDHPASDKAPFGQAVRARSELGGGWLGWVVAVDDIARSPSGSAASRCRATGTAPTASSCAGARSASRACSPTRSSRSSSSGSRPVEQHPSAGSTGDVVAGRAGDRR